MTYTIRYIGDILIALNPFKKLNIYDLVSSRRHLEAENKSSLPPHIFFIANNAYKSMLVGGTPQVVVISGESGAGKTESAKLMIRQVCKRLLWGLVNFDTHLVKKQSPHWPSMISIEECEWSADNDDGMGSRNGTHSSSNIAVFK